MTQTVFDAKKCVNQLIVLLEVHEPVYLSIHVSKPRFLPPSMIPKWGGLRGLVVLLEAVVELMPPVRLRLCRPDLRTERG